MELSIIDGLNQWQILELYDEIIETPENNFFSGLDHYIKCDNGKEGHFCLKGALFSWAISHPAANYICESYYSFSCYNNGSIGCFCARGYSCGYYKYTTYDC